jgi:hypothetical protein
MSTSTIARPKNTKTTITTIALNALTLDPRLQPREKADRDLIDTYAADMARGDVFPPLRVIVGKDAERKTHHWLVDGFHRYTAAKRNQRTEVAVEISDGSFDDAEDHVMTANRTHGARRTQADVQKAIRRALQTTRWQERSDNWIGKHIGCDHKTITTQREQLESTGEIPKLKRLRGEDGKERARKCPPKPVPAPKTTATAPTTDDDERNVAPKKPIGVSATPPVNEATPLGTPTRSSSSIGARTRGSELVTHIERLLLPAFGRLSLTDRHYVLSMLRQTLTQLERQAERTVDAAR